MSVRPILFDDVTKVYTFLHEELNHEFEVPLSEIRFSTDTQGIEDHNFIFVKCAQCNNASIWPVNGGADAPNGQEMFVRHTQTSGCACGQVSAGDNSALPESHVRLNCNRQSHPGRWQVSEQSQVEKVKSGAMPLENSDKMFQVVYNEVDSLIVGLEPAGGVGPNCKVAVIHDMDEYDNLMQFNPAYLSADGDHIVGEPPNAA